METHAQSGDWRITTRGAAILQSRFRTLARPATPFELMDDAVSYYRENFRPLFTISLWVYLIPITVSILLLIPMLLIDARNAGGFWVAIVLDYLGLFLLFPYLVVAPMVHAAFTTLAFRMLAVGEPITLRALWTRLKPRFWNLIANQLLAALALGGIYLVLGVGYILLVLAVIFGVGALAGGSPTLAIVLASVLLATVWFVMLPQIIVLEERTDAITAFSRAVELVRPNLKHATLSCLAFWGIYAVFSIAVMSLAGILLGVVIGVMSIYVDFEQLLERWTLTLNQVYELLSYVAYMLVMPAMYLTSILLYFDLRYRNEGLDIYEALQRGEAGV